MCILLKMNAYDFIALKNDEVRNNLRDTHTPARYLTDFPRRLRKPAFINSVIWRDFIR